jgi:hypothetical protein
MLTVAFYLPQFHPVPENNKWWGPGFSEWTNLARARPLFRGHRQPLIPGELGFYDLRLIDTFNEQAALAKWGGVDAFCFYHYWFAGRKVLERPIEMFRRSPTPDFPFCLCWANHNWTGHWAGRSNDILIEQSYPGESDARDLYLYLRTFLEDRRYLREDGKPVYAVFRPDDMPDVHAFCNRIRDWAKEDGIGELFLLGLSDNERMLDCFDAIAPHSMNIAVKNYLRGIKRVNQGVGHRLFGRPRWVIDYAALIKCFENRKYDGIRTLPTVVPNWDNTPRVGRKGLVLKNSNPSLFHEHVVDSISGFAHRDRGILLVKSWNEWAEGNHLEPDREFGREWLEELRCALGRGGE